MRVSDGALRIPAKVRGFSLLEVLAAIVILALIFAGFVSAYGTVLRHGSDALLHSQATGIASAYLEEILAQPYRDPDDNAVCGSPEAGRAAFDNVCDYDQLTANGCSATSSACPALGSCACDRTGTPIDGLRAFDVSVDINAVTLSGAAGLQVLVNVRNEGLAGNGVAFTAFRTED